jgi:hypothetical protein
VSIPQKGRFYSGSHDISSAKHHSTIAPYPSVAGPEVYDSLNQTAHYHILSLLSWGFVSELATE